MTFCINCGQELAEGAKFCANCGKAVVNSTSTQRKTIYNGEVHKCPNCGEVLKSFVSNCPSCGYEVRGAANSTAVQEFATKLALAKTLEEKVTIIRNFPIPNTKEDILEFMILAYSNFDSLFNQEKENSNLQITDAWLVKISQCYSKAELLFKGTTDFVSIQEIYDKIKNLIEMKKKKRLLKNTLATASRNIVVVIGLIVLIISVFIENSGENSSMIELIGHLVLIGSTCILFGKRTHFVDFGIVGLSAVVSIMMAGLVYNGSMFQLCGGIELVIVVCALLKYVTKK